MRAITTYLVAFFLVTWLHPAGSQPADPDAAAAVAAVERFHGALRAGDTAAAAALLAPDAVVLEGGDLESRRHYLAHHLAEDIKFARGTASKRENVNVSVNGEVAWVTSTSTTQGEFQGKPVSLAGAELVVLSRSSAGWLIRAIHWSSHKKR
ncbi:MAG: nuclear transport factor 2 family protein [Betaproteobacteria bacterium]|nr:nuclear transport factor 2 family protein [Betaproteobacteria bacterium]